MRSIIMLVCCAAFAATEFAQTDSRPSAPPAAPWWAEVLEQTVDPALVSRADHRAAIAATGLPWRVRDRASGIELLLIPPGDFMMGASTDTPSAEPNEKPAHQVTIARPFYLGRFEVTNAQYRKFRPCHASGCWDCRSLNLEAQPATKISFADAKAFCDAFEFRLPTEGEWEYACRAGTTTIYPWGDDPDAGAPFANVADPCVARKTYQSVPFRRTDGYTVSSAVGSLRPNHFGLYDMIGNAREWAISSGSNWSDRSAGVTDPQQFASPVRGIPRGGSWYDSVWACRASCRTKVVEPVRTDFVEGFRVAKSP